VITKYRFRFLSKLIENAKFYSVEPGRCFSQLAGDFFSLIDVQSAAVDITPRVRALRGVLVSPGRNEGEYRHHLEDMHLYRWGSAPWGERDRDQPLRGLHSLDAARVHSRGVAGCIAGRYRVAPPFQ